MFYVGKRQANVISLLGKLILSGVWVAGGSKGDVQVVCVLDADLNTGLSVIEHVTARTANDHTYIEQCYQISWGLFLARRHKPCE